MNPKDIEQLLNRYWLCETSVEEEARLRELFVAGEVPEHLLEYRDLFVYQHAQRESGLDESFDARVLAQVEPSAMPSGRSAVVLHLMPFFKATAAVALIILLNNAVQHSFVHRVDEAILAADTIGQQISAPSIALSDEANSPQTSLKEASDKTEKYGSRSEDTLAVIRLNSEQPKKVSE